MAVVLSGTRDRRAFLGGLGAAALALPLAATARDAIAATPETVRGAWTIGAEEALALHGDGVPFIDVRSTAAFEVGHVPGARLLAFQQFRRRVLAELVDTNAPFVVYNAGAMCPRGAVCTLRAVSWGFAEVRFFRGGFAAWRAAGGAVEGAG